MTAASMEPCRFVARRSPWGRFGSILYTCKRLHRRRRRFKHFWPISLSSPRRFSNNRATFEFGERTDTAIWNARLRAVDRREYTGPRPRSEKRAAIEQRQRAQSHFAPKPVLGGNLDARQQRQPSDPPRRHRGDPPGRLRRGGQPLDSEKRTNTATGAATVTGGDGPRH